MKLDSLKFTFLLFAFVLSFASAFAQNPPTVVSPVNLCLGFPAGPLTATGTDLKWVSPVNSSVGGNGKFDEDGAYVDNSYSNKKTKFVTSVANVTIISVDYTLRQWQEVGNFRLGIYDSAGGLLATSTTVTSFKPTEGSIKITNIFNYKITLAGEYSIGVATGSGNVGAEKPLSSFPIIEPSGAIKIIGTSNGVRLFNNIQFSAQVSTSTAPVPPTDIPGTYNYSVTQTVKGKTSAASTIVVKVNSTPAPTVTSPVNLFQGATPSALTASGSNLLWSKAISSSVGGESFFTSTTYIANQSGNYKRTLFTTAVPNVNINSVDFTLVGNSGGVNGLILGIYQGNILLATSSTVTSGNPSGSKKITNIFNYTIKDPGEYSIGVVSGSGNIGFDNPSFPLSEPSQTVHITGVSDAGFRVFNSIVFSAQLGETSGVAPVPSTTFAGTRIYYVTQTQNGCVSPPATVLVNINGITSVQDGIGCKDQTVTLQASVSDGYRLRWFDAATGGNIEKTGNANDFSFTTPPLAISKTYYVAAFDGTNTSKGVPVQAIIGGYIWKENWDVNKTSWTDPSNWSGCDGGYPTGNLADVSLIESRNKLILSSDITVKSLSLQGNVVIDLNGYTLTVSSISGTGFIKGSGTSKLILKGSLSSTIRFDQTTPGLTNALNTLQIDDNSKAITLDNSLVVSNLLNISGSSVFNTKNNLTLQATASSNANIGSLANGGSIVGNVKVQNYLTGGDKANRNFRTLTSPVYNASTPAKGYRIAGYKSVMFVTGAGGAANGFDPSPNNGATIKYYNEPQPSNKNQYLYPANTSELIAQGQGVYFYYRGNKNDAAGNKFTLKNNNYAVPENVLMEYYGEVNSGTIPLNLSYTNIAGDASNGFNLIGNPYPSVIDWNSAGIIKENLGNTIWVQKQNGTFAIYDKDLPGNGTNGGSQYILPGQGFFVKANAANPKITFTENGKAPSNSPATRLMSLDQSSFMPLSGTDNPVKNLAAVNPKIISLTLIKDDYSSDETLLVFKSNAAEPDKNGISYQGEGAVTLTSVTPNNQYLAINYMSALSDSTEVNLYATATESGTYSFKLSDKNAMTDMSVFLKDKYLNKIINIKSETVYSFDIDKTIAASYGSKRFSLITIPILPVVELIDFAAKKVNKYAELNWLTTTERYSDYFEVEQSIDGKNFFSIGRVKAAVNSDLALKYSFQDKTPAPGANYYRLKQVDNTGAITYSVTILLEGSANFAVLTVYPNPVADKITADIKGLSSDLYQIAVYNINGTKLLTGKGQSLNVASLTKGLYIAEVIDISTNALLGRSKFLKD